MAGQIVHASAVKPIMYPYNGLGQPHNVDRAQNLSGAGSQPSDALYEIGRLQKMAVDKGIPEITSSLSQLEYGSMATLLTVANLVSLPTGGLQLEDFNDAKIDMVQPMKDVNGGTMKQSLYLPELSLSSFQLNIADPEARIERTFEFTGDNYKILREGNKCFIYVENEAPTGTSGNYNIVLNPAPVVNPNQAGEYFFKILRVRAGVTTELVLTTDYTYNNGTQTLTILSALAADTYKIYHSAGQFSPLADPIVENDSDDFYLKAGYVTVSLSDGTTEVELDRLTSLNIQATLNRIDEAVIGSCEKVLRDVQNYTVAVTLNGRVKESTIGEILMGQAGNNWGIIDIAKFIENMTLRVKIYDSCDKTNFLIGYKVTGLSFDSTTLTTPVNDFLTEDVSLNSDNLLISTVIGDITA